MFEVLHSHLLEIAKEFTEICKLNDLRYYMLGGTLLGAVLHEGFIPWDEDMDFGMPREDYEQFLVILKNEGHNFSVNHFSINESPDYPIRLESKKMKIIDNTTGKGVVKYPWIDILPLDGMPNNSFRRKIHSFKLLSLRALYKISQLSTNVAEYNPQRSKFESFVIFISKKVKLENFFDEKKTLKSLEKKLTKFKYDESDFVVDFMGAYKLKEMFPRKIYKESKLYKFEDTFFLGPDNYDSVLKQLYGDYMEIPSVEKRFKHNFEIIDNGFDK